jgi:hypothetical protein
MGIPPAVPGVPSLCGSSARTGAAETRALSSSLHRFIVAPSQIPMHSMHSMQRITEDPPCQNCAWTALSLQAAEAAAGAIQGPGASCCRAAPVLSDPTACHACAGSFFPSRLLGIGQESPSFTPLMGAAGVFQGSVVPGRDAPSRSRSKALAGSTTAMARVLHDAGLDRVDLLRRTASRACGRLPLYRRAEAQAAGSPAWPRHRVAAGQRAGPNCQPGRPRASALALGGRAAAAGQRWSIRRPSGRQPARVARRRGQPAPSQSWGRQPGHGLSTRIPAAGPSAPHAGPPSSIPRSM